MLIQPGQFRTKTVRPSLTDFQVESQTKGQLIKESAALVPDAEKITEQVMKFDLSPVDSARVKAQANHVLADYVDKYRKNPYYAFSREAINQTQDLQNIVNNPELSRMSEFYKQSKKEYDKLDQAQLLSSTAYADGGLRVLNRKTDQTETIDLDDFNPNVHVAMDIQSDYSDRVSNRGFINDDRPFQYNLNDPTKVTDKLLKYFSSLGDTEVESLSGAIKTSSRSNKAQMEKALEAVFSGSGLSSSDINTLIAQQITPALRSGKRVSKDQAWKDVTNYIYDLAQSKGQYREDSSVNPEFTAMNQAATTSAALGKLSPLQEAFSGIGVQKVNLPLKAGNRETLVQGFTLPPQVWTGSEFRKVGDEVSGGKEAMSNLKSLMGGMMASDFLVSDAKVLNAKNDAFENIDVESIAPNVVLDRSKSHVLTVPYIIENGNKVYKYNTTTAQLQKENPNAQIGEDTVLKTRAKVMDGGWNKDERLGKFGNELRQRGYQADYKDPNKFYENNVSPDATNRTDWFNNDYFEFDLFIPTTASNQFAGFGTEGYTPKSTLTHGTEQSSNPYSKAANASNYPTFDNLFITGKQ